MGKLSPDHILEMFESIVSDETKKAFFELYSSLLMSSKYNAMSVSKGKFKAVHFCTTVAGRPFGNSVGDAEFAFKAGKNYLTWWFRQPALNSGIINPDEVTHIFSTNTNNKGELVVKLRNVGDVTKLLEFIPI